MERIFIALLIAQILMGAIDTLVHHEWMETLATRRTAALELRLHAIRAAVYGGLFLVFAWLRPQGAWLAVVWGLLLVEVAVTLWDFVIEDATRLLPPSERVLHTVLAINGGAMLALYALITRGDWSAPTGWLVQDRGAASWFLTLAALGIAASALRDALAAKASAAEPAPRGLLAERPPMQWLISGGTGFIGSALVDGLLAGGHRPVLLTRNPRRAALRFDGRVRCIADVSELRSEERIDAVVNLAGAPVVGWPWTAARRRVLLRSRIDTTRALLSFCDRAVQRPALWLQASAIGLYGQQAKQGREATVATPQPDDFASEMCCAWEATARGAAASGIRLVTMRFGLVLDRSGGLLPPLSLAAVLGAGAVLGDGRQWFAWVHLRDVLRFVEHAVRRGDVRGPFNLVAPGGLTQREFANALAGHYRRPRLLRMPAWPLRAALGEMASMLLDGPRVSSQRLAEHGYRFESPTLNEALGGRKVFITASGVDHGTVEPKRAPLDGLGLGAEKR